MNFISGKKLNDDIAPIMRKFYASNSKCDFSHCKCVPEFTKLQWLLSWLSEYLEIFDVG